MDSFDPQEYGAKISELLSEDRLCELGPGKQNSQVLPQLDQLQPDDIVPHVQDYDMASCCVAGLWLWHDFLDRSHDYSQEIHSSSGSYWHAIMHRREPDYSNSKYWYRRAGEHEIFSSLHEYVNELASEESDSEFQNLAASASWDPYAFVDLCASVARGRSNAQMACRNVAQREWQLLFDYCFQRA